MLESGYKVFDGQIVKLLSENDVYQSYLVNSSCATAAKLFLLLPDPLFDQKHRQAFFDLADWLSSQTFPCIGSPLKAGDIEGQAACLYPSPPGIPLLQTIDKAFSVRQAVELVKKIAECLRVPHSADLWHGNLSPDTIYLDGDAPYLADFSLNQLIRLDYNSGIKPQYTSPEQVRGETPGTAADIYNLGCIFYHLLTGRPPFPAGDAFTVAKQHLQGSFPRLSEELSLLQSLLDSMTEIAIEERITIDELIDQVTQLSTQQQIDQLPLSVPMDDQQLDDSTSSKDISLFDEALDNSEIAARIEARLKEHAGDFQEMAPAEIPLTEENDVTDGLDQVNREEKSGFWRFVLVLLLGVVIGSGLYFLFYKQSPAVPHVVVEHQVDTVDVLTADLDQGLRLWQDKDYNGAETEFKRIIADFHEDPRAYNNLAAFYAAQGNYDQARDYLELALATDKNYATIYRNLGLVYAEMARGSYGRALQLDKTQALISLPVFSSQGVVKLKSMAEDIMAIQEQSSETVSTPSLLAEAGQQIAAVEVVSEDVSTDAPSIVPEQQEQLEVVAEKASGPVEKEEQPVVVTKVEKAEQPNQPNQNEAVDVDRTASKQESAENFLRRWAQAWSNQDVDSYLTFYGEQFIPPAGRKRADWEALRRTRLTAPKDILISLDDFQIIPQENNRTRIEVIQSYKSNLLTARYQKVFDLQQTENSWEILRERSLGRVR